MRGDTEPLGPDSGTELDGLAARCVAGTGLAVASFSELLTDCLCPWGVL